MGKNALVKTSFIYKFREILSKSLQQYLNRHLREVPKISKHGFRTWKNSTQYQPYSAKKRKDYLECSCLPVMQSRMPPNDIQPSL